MIYLFLILYTLIIIASLLVFGPLTILIVAFSIVVYLALRDKKEL